MATRVGSYVLEDTVGYGAVGKVKRGVHTVSGEQVAVKVCNKKDLRRRGELTATVCREIAIIKALRHRNLVGLRQVHSSKNKLYIVTDLVDGGCAFDRLLTLPAPTVEASSDLGGAPAPGVTSGGVPEADARALFIQLAAAIAYCHRRGVAHRCLKPENLLLGPNGQLLISDLAVAALHGAADASELFITTVATPNYVAPELIVTAAAAAAAEASGKTRAPGRPAPEGVNEHGVVPPPDYSPEAVDAWSSGVILYTLLAGFLPWDAPSVNGVLTKITAAPLHFPPHVPSPARHLLRQLLDKNPASRADLRHVLHHPWCLAGPSRELSTLTAAPAPSVAAASVTTTGVAAFGSNTPTTAAVVPSPSAKPGATTGSSPAAPAAVATARPSAPPLASDDPVKRSAPVAAKVNGPRRRPSRKTQPAVASNSQPSTTHKSQPSVAGKPVSTSKSPTAKSPTDKHAGKVTSTPDPSPKRAPEAAPADAVVEPATVKSPTPGAPTFESPTRDKSAATSHEPAALQVRATPQDAPVTHADPIASLGKDAGHRDLHSASVGVTEDQVRPAGKATALEEGGGVMGDVPAPEKMASVTPVPEAALVAGTSHQKWRKRLVEQDLTRAVARNSKPGQRPKRPSPVVPASEGSGAEEDDLDVTVVSSADAVSVDLDIAKSSSTTTSAAPESSPTPATADSSVKDAAICVQDAVEAIRQLRELISRTSQTDSDEEDEAFVDALSSPENAPVHELMSPTSATSPESAGQDGGIRPVLANLVAGDSTHVAPGQSRLSGQSALKPGAPARTMTRKDFHKLLQYAATGVGASFTEATTSSANGHPGRVSARAQGSGSPSPLGQVSGAPLRDTMAQALSTVRTALTGSPKLSVASLAAVEHVLDAWQGALAHLGSVDDLDVRSASAIKLGDTVSDSELSTFQELLSQCHERLQAWADGGGTRDVLSPEKMDALVTRRSGDNRGRPPLSGGKASSIASTLPSPNIRGKFIGGAFSIERGPRMSHMEPGGDSAGDDGSELSEDDEVVAVDFGDDALLAEEINSGERHFMDTSQAPRSSTGEALEQPRLFLNLASDGETLPQPPAAVEAEHLQLDDVFLRVESPAPLATGVMHQPSRPAPPPRVIKGSRPSVSSDAPSTPGPVGRRKASGSAVPTRLDKAASSTDITAVDAEPAAGRHDSDEMRPGEDDLRKRRSDGADDSAKPMPAVVDASASTTASTPLRGPGAMTLGSADEPTCGQPSVGFHFLSSLAPVRCLNEVGRLLAALGCDVVRKRGEFKLRCSAARPDGVLAASVEIAPVVSHGGMGDGGSASSSTGGGVLTSTSSADGEPRSTVTFRRSQKTEVSASAFVDFFDTFFGGLAHAVGGSARPSSDVAAAAAADASPVGS
ncbi:hypothetical protein MMPV_008683 [Pyropia vietnamensis]